MVDDADPAVKHIELVREQADHFRRRADKYAAGRRDENPSRYRFYTDMVERHLALVAYLEGFGKRESAATSTGQASSSRAARASLGDLDDLPPELLAQLSVKKTDPLEDDILEVIETRGGAASVDQLLVDLYRKTKVIHERRYLTNKLYRMAQKELIASVSGKKGIYALWDGGSEDDGDQVDLFGADHERPA